MWRDAQCPTSRILHVSPDAPRAHCARVQQLAEGVSTDLGLPPGWLLSCAAPHAFIAVSSAQRIAGVLIAEQIREAVRALPRSVSGDVLRCAPGTVPAMLGVRAVWVHPSARRTGVATRLLDAARNALVAGLTVPMTAVAFTQPSPEGRLFAEACCGREDVLVYE